MEPEYPMALVVTYDSDDRSRRLISFDNLVDGQRMSHQEMTRSRPPCFLEVVYPIDWAILIGKEKVTVPFEATEGNTVQSVCGIRMIRNDTDSLSALSGRPLEWGDPDTGCVSDDNGIGTSLGEAVIFILA
jgi:hypothetical protein